MRSPKETGVIPDFRIDLVSPLKFVAESSSVRAAPSAMPTRGFGAALATSTYKAPEVLLEIGTNPPATSFTDRSRVSITFEEAPKYGISYSQASDQKDSVMQGYAPKRARYFPFLDRVNQAIAQTHSNYGSTEDDTVFWWGCSAFYTHQTVRWTFQAVKTFGLDTCPVFKGALPPLIRLVGGTKRPSIAPFSEASSAAWCWAA